MKYTSKVIQGFGRGRTLGFPTFNLEIPAGFDCEYGIYAAWIWIGNEQYQGAMHYGPIPTFDHAKPSLEIFALDYTKNEPEEQLDFEVVKFIRGVMRFDSPEDLKKQITVDVNTIRNILAQQIK